MATNPIPVVVTRAQPGAEDTAERLRTLQLQPILSPVLSLRANPAVQIPSLESVSGLIFTSANGVRTFADRSSNRALPAWCVGPATAAAAGEAGFLNVRESAGDAGDLAAFITAQAQPAQKPLLHVANSAAKGDLKRELERSGFSVLFCPLYDMEPVTRLPEAVHMLGQQRRAAIILFHSSKGADAFLTACGELNLSAFIAVAISTQVATPLLPAGFLAIYRAERPNEAALFAALDKAMTHPVFSGH